MTEEQLRQFVAEASASPSVHNVQPARWHIEGDTLLLLEDPTRRLAAGDPRGNDAAISLGAAAEGLVLAASNHGHSTAVQRCKGDYGDFRRVARLSFAPSTRSDPLGTMLSRRASWRGDFAPARPEDATTAAELGGGDRTIVAGTASIRKIGALYDRASYGFMRNNDFRAELRGWMRLRMSHPRWSLDGLNADAMKLSKIEAFAAGLVLGPLFRPLAMLGLAPYLLAEVDGFANAAGIALFHRPRDEDPFESGRHFHRLWLEIEASGFGANVLAALADDPDISARICAEHKIPQDRRLVSVFRFGRRTEGTFARARLSVADILVD